MTKLQQLFDPKLSKAVEAVVLSVYGDPGITKKKFEKSLAQGSNE